MKTIRHLFRFMRKKPQFGFALCGNRVGTMLGKVAKLSEKIVLSIIARKYLTLKRSIPFQSRIHGRGTTSVSLFHMTFPNPDFKISFFPNFLRSCVLII
jgi:hypothetical protein